VRLPYDIMQTIWAMVFTGVGVAMIAATAAAIVGLCIVIWTTRRID
jgi:hypothetical protein